MLPLHPPSPKGTPIHPRLRKSGAFWAVLCKTGLALEVAVEIGGSFADGYSFVYLAPISDPGLVMPAIVQTLGIGKAGTVQRLNA